MDFPPTFEISYFLVSVFGKLVFFLIEILVPIFSVSIIMRRNYKQKCIISTILFLERFAWRYYRSQTLDANFPVNLHYGSAKSADVDYLS